MMILEPLANTYIIFNRQELNFLNMAKLTLGRAPSNQNPPKTEMREEFNSLDRRMKIIEERYTNMRSKTKVMEQNMLTKNKTFFTEIKALNVEMTEVKKEISELKDRISSLVKELEAFAKKENVDILKKYIDIWNPVNFVSKNEVEEMVTEVIEKIRKEE